MLVSPHALSVKVPARGRLEVQATYNLLGSVFFFSGHGQNLDTLAIKTNTVAGKNGRYLWSSHFTGWYRYIYIHMCIHIYIYIHICVGVHVHMYIYIYIYVCMYIYICISLSIYIYIYINRETNEYIYAYLCIYEPYGYGEVILNDYYFFRMYNTKPYESCPSVKRY